MQFHKVETVVITGSGITGLPSVVSAGMMAVDSTEVAEVRLLIERTEVESAIKQCNIDRSFRRLNRCMRSKICNSYPKYYHDGSVTSNLNQLNSN